MDILLLSGGSILLIYYVMMGSIQFEKLKTIPVYATSKKKSLLNFFNSNG